MLHSGCQAGKLTGLMSIAAEEGPMIDFRSDTVSRPTAAIKPIDSHFARTRLIAVLHGYFP